MKHEKIISRDNGKSVKIEVRFYDFGHVTDHHGNYFRYDVDVAVKPKGKRNFNYSDDIEATKDEIYAAKLELWEKYKPLK